MGLRMEISGRCMVRESFIREISKLSIKVRCHVDIKTITMLLVSRGLISHVLQITADLTGYQFLIEVVSWLSSLTGKQSRPKLVL